MRTNWWNLRIAGAALVAATSLVPTAAADEKAIPVPAPPVAGEPVYGAPDPGQDVGERISSLLAPADELKSGDELPSLALGIIGVTGDPITGYTVVVGPDVPPATILKLIIDGLSPAARAMVSLKVGSTSAAALQTAWQQVNTRAKALLAGDSYWMDVDPSLQKVIVGVDTTGVSDATIIDLEATAPGLVQVDREGGSARTVRNVADSAPHWGASIIRPTYDTSQYCSAGFSVWRNNTNADASVTAGHCGTPGGNGGDFNSGSYFYGTKAGTSDHPDYDQARLQGSSYAAYIRTNGGDDAENLRAVRGATDPVIGDSVCQSGVTSYAECSIVIGSLTAQFCDASGCTTNLASGRRADDTFVVRPGDSGGPVYLRFSGAKAGIRGMVVAGGDGNSTGTAFRRLFLERYNSIANHLNVRIMVL